MTETRIIPLAVPLKAFVRELALDPIEEDDDDFAAALVMLAAVRLGNRDLGALSRLTEVPLPLVEEFAGRLRANGVWQSDGKTHAEWDAEDGVLAFWLDVWVATGRLEKGPANDGVNPGELGVSDAGASARDEPSPTGGKRP